jgi:cytochrome c556
MRILSAIVVVAGLGMAGIGAQAPARISEADYDALMKKVGPANAAMRMKLMNNQVKEAAADAQALATLFGDVERFWVQHKKDDAVKWAADARSNAAEVAGAAAAGDGMKAQTAANNILASCKQCHGMYREGDQQTGFRIKAGTLAD